MERNVQAYLDNTEGLWLNKKDAIRSDILEILYDIKDYISNYDPSDSSSDAIYTNLLLPLLLELKETINQETINQD